MTEQQAQFLVEQLTRLWEGEFPATCAVLAAVPDGGREYRPDEKSRTAWELATHLATADIWFMDSLLAGAFVWDADAGKQQAAAFSSIADVVEYYRREFPAKLAAVRAMPAARMAQVVDFFGMFQWPNASFLGFANNHSVHHRGQLASYLRAMGSKVPAIYGSSADVAMGS
jgi:uncharacterized damage-inducible protein DinB